MRPTPHAISVRVLACLLLRGLSKGLKSCKLSPVLALIVFYTHRQDCSVLQPQYKLKTLITSVVALLCYLNSYSQVQYIATESASKTFNSKGQLISKTPFKQMSRKATIYLYSNYLVYDGEPIMETFKFARKVNITNGNDSYVRWNALDQQGRECQIQINDYGTYSIVNIFYVKDKYMLLYKTL
jgi:hypothetical protein